MTFPVERVAKSRLRPSDIQQAPFGTIFSDHMFLADYRDGAWANPRIVPYGDLTLSPATSAIHYGQSIFEGMKAFRQEDGEVVLYRPDAHLQRLNRSAARLAMPELPIEMGLEALKQLVSLDKDWVPDQPGSLYLRPTYFGTDPFIAVKPSQTYTFMIFTSPSVNYYTKELSVYVSEAYVRAAEGGVGTAKMAGNYAGSMLMNRYAQQHGFDVVLWLDAKHHLYVEEFSTMNVFFVLDGKVVTPRLRGTILEGITRDSLITLLRERNYEVEERDVSMKEIVAAHHEGRLQEFFGAGTAAMVAPVRQISYQGELLDLPPTSGWQVAPMLRQYLTDIRLGKAADTHGWLTSLN